jgi:hypothetical protein
LVSKTGQGLLSSTGLIQKQICRPYYIQEKRDKTSRQFFDNLTLNEIYAYSECNVSENEKSIPALVVLTKEKIYIFDEINFSILQSWKVKVPIIKN